MKSDSRTIRVLRERFGDPIGSYAGNPPVGVRDESLDVCHECGMLSINDACSCEQQTCQCGMPPHLCDCRGHDHDMREGLEPCRECGMLEVEGTCGCTHNESDLGESDVDEVTPPGKEKLVKALKKKKDIDNPWAVAWSQYNKEKQ